MSAVRTILCLASYFKGHRFLTRCKKEGCHVILLTVESLLGEAWPRELIDEVFALPTFHDERTLLNAVSYLARTRTIDLVVALDDFDVEIAATIREHFRLPGLGESAARLFRDKLAMRVKSAEIGVRIPAFTGIFNHDRVREFLAEIPPPWLLKPRSQASAAGIRKLHTAADVWKEIERLGDEQSFYLLEQFIPGDLYHVDSLVADNAIIFAEVNGYGRPLLDVYQGGGVYMTRTVPRDRPEVAALRAANEQVLVGFGLGRGVSHTEFLKSHLDGSIYLVETSARVGGSNTAEMVEAARGINLWDEWAALEVYPSDPPLLPPQHERYAGV
jgi:biotin carboxylase